MSSVAALQPAVVVFREEQYFDWRVYALSGSLVVLTCLGLLWWADRISWEAMLPAIRRPDYLFKGALALGVPTGLIFMLLLMTTEVRPAEIRVWFGWIPFYRRLIDVESIRTIEVVTFRPLLDHGGWGIRSGREGERVLSARGNRGVRLELADGTRILIGSQRPEALAIAIKGSPGVDGGA
ncbi:MAG: hypothetical protein ABS79_06575 [Planctomycetes bacterium SCN 63-9]|nr:MAG: hypothetical protein ABS79_06575 [Planctomycetes bacterium SCN 63-9]